MIEKSSKPEVSSGKLQNKPLVIGSSPLEEAILRRKGLIFAVLGAILVIAAIYYSARRFVDGTFRHVEFSNSQFYLGDAETRAAVLEKWMDDHLNDLPARRFVPQFGYRMDVQNFTAVLVAGAMNAQALPASCFRTSLQEGLFECGDGEIVAWAKIGGETNLSVNDFSKSGTISIRGQEIPYSTRTTEFGGVELQQLIADVGAGSYVIIQMPKQVYSMARVMEVFSKNP